MADERWISPFNSSLAYVLFMKHFTELNTIYWAHVPASNTVIKHIKQKSVDNPTTDFCKLFVVKDEDERRLASDYNAWNQDYKEFLNYTRLNMLMLLSSAFETYLRTIVSLAIESKPGTVLGCPESIDGAFLLKKDINYGMYNDKNYLFSNIIDDVCRGEWSKRVEAYEKYFGTAPTGLKGNISKLDELRRTRNEIGHYFGRKKNQYETPILMAPKEVERVSHDNLIKYMNTVHKTVKSIDEHLHITFVGSYDIIKFYFQEIHIDSKDLTPGIQAKNLQKHLGEKGLRTAGTEYYKNLLSYMCLEDKDQMCGFGQKSCVKEINRCLLQKNIGIIESGKKKKFNNFMFSLFSKEYNFKNNPEYCKKYTFDTDVYLYSSKVIDLIVTEVAKNPMGIIDALIEKHKRISSATT